jgi:ribonucleotide reductase alpha subunit
MNYSEVAKRIQLNGEPGLAWLDNMQKYSRMNGIVDNKDHRVRGGNPCVSGDTLVLTDGGLKSVLELVGKQFNAVVDSVTCPSTSVGFWKTGTLPVYNLMLNNGMEIKATENHKFLLLEGQKREKKWTELQGLQVGQLLAVAQNTNFKWSGGKGTYMEGYMIGALIADGTFFTMESGAIQPLLYVTVPPSYNPDPKSIPLNYRPLRVLQEYILSRPGHISTFKGFTFQAKTKNGYVLYRMQCKVFRGIVEQFDIKPLIKHVPENGSYEFTRGMLRGLFDFDGCVATPGSSLQIEMCQTELHRLLAIQRLLSALGIICNVRRDVRPSGRYSIRGGDGIVREGDRKAMHKLTISSHNLVIFKDVVGFYDEDNERKLVEGLAAYTIQEIRPAKWCSRIVSISPCGTEDVYDCTVPGVDCFSANGIIAHNCLEQSLESYELCCLVRFSIQNTHRRTIRH